MTDEQKAALQDALAPLQEWESTPLEDIAEQAASAVRVCKALAMDCLPYQPPTEEQIVALARDAGCIAQAFRGAALAMEAVEKLKLLRTNAALQAQADAMIKLAGVPFGELPKPEEQIDDR